MTARRVWDAFPFCGELDLLEARLTELDPVVHRFVLAESELTFQGTPKPLYYLENRDRFAPWQDKIIHVVADLSGYEGHWARDHAAREAIFAGLDDLGPDDIFLLSDVDEIPRAEAVHLAPGRAFAYRHHMVAVNLLDPGWMVGTVGILGRPQCGMQELRDKRGAYGKNPVTTAAGQMVSMGWHFSWLGGPEAMRAKAHSFAHTEQTAFVDAHAERIYAERRHPAAGAGRLVLCEIDDTWPVYMQQRRGPAAWYWPGGN